MKKAIKMLLLLPALSISASQLFSNYYGKTETTNKIEVLKKGFPLAINNAGQTDEPGDHFNMHGESISSICRKN